MILPISGMQVTYSNGTTTTHGETSCDEVHEFRLESDEYIVKVDVSSGWMVDRLTFYTNTGHQYGPYGGPGGGSHSALPPIGENAMYGHLAFIKGKIVQSYGTKGITYLTFVWGYYDFGCHSREKHDERLTCHLPDQLTVYQKLFCDDDNDDDDDDVYDSLSESD